MTKTMVNAATGQVTVDAGFVKPDWSPTLAERREKMVVSRFQAKAALAAAGLLTSAETAVSDADATAQLAWSEAIEFRRNSPTIATLAMALYPGEPQETVDANLDALFAAAALIEA